MSLHGMLRRKNGTEGLTSAALWSVLGTLIYAGCQWGVLVTTVRLTSPKDVGNLSLGFAISAPIFLFLHLRLRSASATDVNGEFSTADYLNLRVVCTLLALAITYFVCSVVHLGEAETTIVMWVAGAKALESGSDLLYGFSQKANDMRVVSLSMMGRGVLSFASFTALLVYTRSVVAGLIGLCAAWGVILILVDIPYTYSSLRSSGNAIGKFHWRSRAMITLAAATLPLGFSTMLMSLSSNMPRYFIQRYLGSVDLGIFAATGYLAMAASVIVSALAEAGIARMARHISSGDITGARSLLRKIVHLTLLLSISGIAVSAMFGEQAIKMLYSGIYSSAFSLLVWMMVVSGIANLASVYGFALVAGRCYTSYLQCLIGLTVSMAVACAILIPKWGTKGAVSACICGYAIQLLWSYLKTQSMFAKPAISFASSVMLNESKIA